MNPANRLVQDKTLKLGAGRVEAERNGEDLSPVFLVETATQIENILQSTSLKLLLPEKSETQVQASL